MNIGGPIRVTCRRDGRTYRGTELHGDFDLITAGMGSAWETFGSYRSFILRLRPTVLSSVAESSGAGSRASAAEQSARPPRPATGAPRQGFQERSRGGIAGRQPFADALGTALVVRLAHLSDSPESPPAPAGKRPRRMTMRDAYNASYITSKRISKETSGSRTSPRQAAECFQPQTRIPARHWPTGLSVRDSPSGGAGRETSHE